MSYDFESIISSAEYVDPRTGRLQFVKFNPHPKKLNVGDCVKRAIVVVTGLDYHELALDMNRKRVKPYEPFNMKVNWQPYVEKILGGKKIKTNVPAGRSRWNIENIGTVMKPEHVWFGSYFKYERYCKSGVEER